MSAHARLMPMLAAILIPCFDASAQSSSSELAEVAGPWGGPLIRLPAVPLQDKTRRQAFDAKVSEYLMQMESVRLLRGDKNSGKLVLAWNASKSPNIDAHVATQIVDQVSGDLPEVSQLLAAYLFVKPGAAGDVKRSTLPPGTAWSVEERSQAKIVGNNIAGALSAHVGLSDRTTTAAAGAVQLVQDVNYIARDYAAKKCALLNCVQRTFEDHWPGTDDPKGMEQTDAGRRRYQVATTLQGVKLIRKVVRDSVSGAAAVSSPGNSNFRRAPRNRGVPEKWTKREPPSSSQRESKYKSEEVMADSPYTPAKEPKGQASDPASPTFPSRLP